MPKYEQIITESRLYRAPFRRHPTFPDLLLNQHNVFSRTRRGKLVGVIVTGSSVVLKNMVRTTGHRITGSVWKKDFEEFSRCKLLCETFTDVAALFVLCIGRAVHVAPTRDAF